MDQQLTPDIPPRCSYFRKIADKWHFNAWDSEICIEDYGYIECREVIACIAICFWQRYLERVERSGKFAPKYGSVDNTIWHVRAVMKRWRKWGGKR